MLLRSFKLPPSLLLLIVFLAFFGWQLSQGTRHENAPVDSEVIPQTHGGKQTPRIALMTFVTDQRSYLHLSLKNKDRKHRSLVQHGHSHGRMLT
jgi:mannan polymerase II complex MNN10 subunit